MSGLVVFKESEIAPQADPPFFPEALVGNPKSWGWRIATSEDGLVASGFWKCTPGVWRMDYKLWEFCHVIEGRCVITPTGGKPVHLAAGDAFVCEPGLQGTWEIVETMRKHFVVRRSGAVS